MSPDSVAGGRAGGSRLQSRAVQTTMALENVELHEEARHQGLTDKLTSLANHGRFQEELSGEMEHVRRYSHPVGLIMLEVDDFKQVNDSYGNRGARGAAAGRDGVLRVAASLGVGVTTEGDKDTLIATTDAALYQAK